METPPSQHFLYFSGLDLWRNGAALHGGVEWTPGSIDASGFVLKFFGSEGVYRYLSGATPIRGVNFTSALMPGWRFIDGALRVTVFAGLDFQRHDLTPDDPASRLRGTHVGARVGADVWWQPMAETMVTGSFSVSSIGNGYWARAAAGKWLFDRVWTGPEFIASGDADYQQWRLGMHVTGLRFENFEWSAGAGWVRDSDHRSGLYARFGMLARR